VQLPSECPGVRRAGRPKARDVVMRVLYESAVSGDDPLEILELVFGRFRFTEDGRRHAERLVAEFCEHREPIDQALSQQLENWDLGRVGAIERAIMRLVVTELLYIGDTPARVALDEALRLAQRYGTERSVAFINGVCDPIARAARGAELPPEPSPDARS
jgi:N utilization substance protein B